jgi:hypothetical protein
MTLKFIGLKLITSKNQTHNLISRGIPLVTEFN